MLKIYRKKLITMRSIILAAVCFLPLGLAYAGLFGPSNYDECVLDGVKDAKTDTAARLVAQACRNKFPDKTQTSKPITVWFDLYDRDNGSFVGFTDKISIVSKKQHGYSDELRVMNNYSFNLQNIAIGVIKKSFKGDKCPSNFSDYKEVIQCNGYAAARQSGNFVCAPTNGAYCVTGFAGEFGSRTEKEINEIIRKEIHPK